MTKSRFSRQRKGVSALFDALVFFVILLVASGVLMLAVTSIAASTAESDSTRELGRYASEVQASALVCTVGPQNCTVNGSEVTMGLMSVMKCIVTIIDIRLSGNMCLISNLTSVVLTTYSLLINNRFHFAVLAELDDNGSPFFLSDSAGSTAQMGRVRWTNAVPLHAGGSEGTLTLFLWR